MGGARREFEEETGQKPDGTFIPLQAVTQRSGKRIAAWAFEGDFDPSQLRSTTFMMEWPPRSGAQQEFPEVDRAAWFSLAEARRKLVPAQAELVDRLEALLRPASGI